MTREEAKKALEEDLTKVSQFSPKMASAYKTAISALSTEGEYIKKSELLQHVTTEELSDYKDCDVIHAEEIDKLKTYSFPDSAENKGDTVSRAAYEQIMRERDTAVQQLKDLGYGLGEKPKENKGDLISRQAVLDELEKWDWQDLYLPSHFKQILDDVPSGEKKGEPKIGHWIERHDDWGSGIITGRRYKCSVCHGKHIDPETGEWHEVFDYKYPYCPNCGAKMIEPQESEEV